MIRYGIQAFLADSHGFTLHDINDDTLAVGDAVSVPIVKHHGTNIRSIHSIGIYYDIVDSAGFYLSDSDGYALNVGFGTETNRIYGGM